MPINIRRLECSQYELLIQSERFGGLVHHLATSQSLITETERMIWCTGGCRVLPILPSGKVKQEPTSLTIPPKVLNQKREAQYVIISRAYDLREQINLGATPLTRVVLSTLTSTVEVKGGSPRLCAIFLRSVYPMIQIT